MEEPDYEARAQQAERMRAIALEFIVTGSTQLAARWSTEHEVGVAFVLDESPMLNAFAEAADGRGAYTLGLTHRLADECAKRLAALFFDERLLALLCSGSASPSNPAIEVERGEAVAQCVRFLTEYVLFHEFGHIERGHVDWHGHTFGNKLFLERGPEQPQVDPVTWQALELDADMYAITFALAVPEKERMPRLCGFALGTLLLTFAAADRDLHAFRAQTHPHPTVRRDSIIYLLDHMAKGGTISRSTFDGFLWGLIVASRMSKNLLGHDFYSGSSGGLEDVRAVLRRSADIVDPTLTRLHAVNKELAPFAFATRAP